MASRNGARRANAPSWSSGTRTPSIRAGFTTRLPTRWATPASSSTKPSPAIPCATICTATARAPISICRRAPEAGRRAQRSGPSWRRPDRDVVSITGDGFYIFASANAALWSAAHYKAPFMSIIYQNRSYSTGVLRVANVFPDGYAAKAGYDGGYFDPPIDFAKEAEAAGAYGENVRDPAEIAPAIARGLKQIRAGKPAVISVWLPRLLQKD